MSYRAQHTGTLKTVTLMVAVWVAAFLVHGPILVSETRKELGADCKPEFLEKWHILALTLLFEFVIPVLLVAYFNMYIYWSLWKRSHLSRGHSGFISAPSSSSGRSFRNGLFSRPSLSNLEESAASLRSEKSGRKSSLLSSLRPQMNSLTASKTSSLSHSDSLALHQREHLELRRGKKLAKSLAILLGVFAVCWAPYSLFTIIRSCHGTHSDLSNAVYEFTFWLQWFNSFVNPFLYPCVTRVFRRPSWNYFGWKSSPYYHIIGQHLLEDNHFAYVNFVLLSLKWVWLSLCPFHSTEKVHKNVTLETLNKQIKNPWNLEVSGKLFWWITTLLETDKNIFVNSEPQKHYIFLSYHLFFVF